MDPNFLDEVQKFDKLAHQLRMDNRMPKVIGELLNVKIDLETKIISSAQPEFNLFLRNLQKPKHLNKHQWEVVKKKKLIEYNKLKKKQRESEPLAIQQAQERLSKLYESYEVRKMREAKEELEARMSELYGLKVQKGDQEDDFQNLLHHKAIIDLIRYGANLEINSQLIKGYLNNRPSKQYRDVDTQYIKEVDLNEFKKWDLDLKAQKN